MNMFTVDNLQSKPFFRDMHPAEKLLFAAVQVALCSVFAYWQVCLFTACLSVGLLMLASPSRRMAIRMLAAPVAFLLPACLSVAVELDAGQYWHSTQLFGYTLGVSHGSVSYAVLLFAKAFAASSALILVAAVTPVHQIEYLLQRIGLPPVLIDLFGMVYRFIGLLLSVFVQIQMAQQARALSLRPGGRIRGAGLVAGALLRKAIWYQQWASYSAQARGYSGQAVYGGCDADISYSRLMLIVLYAASVAAGVLLYL